MAYKAPHRSFSSSACGCSARPGTSRRHARARAATGAEPSTSVKPFEIPSGSEAATRQSIEAIKAAYASGVQRQRIDALLPLIGATDLDDWPGGIRQQFKAAVPMIETMLKTLRADLEMGGKIDVKVLDQGDAVGTWFNEDLFVVIFPTGETLPKIEEMAAGKKLVIMINPQWTGGQIVSDFGIFGRKKKEAFVNSFTTTYSLQTKRMCGEDIRTLTMDGKTHLFVREGQRFAFVDAYDTLPSYFDLEKVLVAREGSVASMSLAERIQSEMKFNQDSLKGPNQ